MGTSVTDDWGSARRTCAGLAHLSRSGLGTGLARPLPPIALTPLHLRTLDKDPDWLGPPARGLRQTMPGFTRADFPTRGRPKSRAISCLEVARSGLAEVVDRRTWGSGPRNPGLLLRHHR